MMGRMPWSVAVSVVVSCVAMVVFFDDLLSFSYGQVEPFAVSARLNDAPVGAFKMDLLF